MESLIKGQPQAEAVIQKLLKENTFGRTLIFLGERGCGKFSAAVDTAEKILLKNPFSSADFIFYRNDNYSIKSRFMLKNYSKGAIKTILPSYLSYLLGRLSTAISMSEIGNVKLKRISQGKESSSIQEFRNELDEIIINQKYYDLIESNPSFSENLIAVSDELSKKQRIPIDFIRSAIEFNSMKTSGGHKITLIGNFENAAEEAQNAALKLLEEPPAGNLIILTANSSAGILPTILSRSMIIHFIQLSPSVLKDIFGMDFKKNYYSTADLMEDDFFHFEEERKKKVLEFFTEIAPRIQFNNAVFSFIDNLISDENSKLSRHFFSELGEFLRNVHLMRQEYLRGVDLSAFIDQDYKKMAHPIIPHVNTGELKELAFEIGRITQKIKFNNVSPAVVLPSLLIDMARWYQRSNRKPG